jgi:hypothetical protein
VKLILPGSVITVSRQIRIQELNWAFIARRAFIKNQTTDLDVEYCLMEPGRNLDAAALKSFDVALKRQSKRHSDVQDK